MEQGQIYTCTKTGENDINMCPADFISFDRLLYILTHYIDFDTARQLSRGIYNVNGHTIELTKKNIELILSVSYHTEKKKLSHQMEELSRRLKTRKEEYYRERQKRDIPMENDRLRKEIQELKQEIEKKGNGAKFKPWDAKIG